MPPRKGQINLDKAAKSTRVSRDILVTTGKLTLDQDFEEEILFPPQILGDKFSSTLLEALSTTKIFLHFFIYKY